MGSPYGKVTNKIPGKFMFKGSIVNNLGPGQYEALCGFQSIENSMKQVKNIEKLKLHKSGIAGIKPSSSFASKQKRFEQKSDVRILADDGTIEQVVIMPGPGTYHTEIPWLHDQRSIAQARTSSSLSILQSVVVPSAPSIPSHQNVFGYEENERGQLIKQVNQDQYLTGTGDQKVGPGHYLALTENHKIAGPVVTWKSPHEKSKKIQAILKEKLKQPGPGSYISLNSNNRSKQPSSFFVSGKIRSDGLVTQSAERARVKGIGGVPHGERILKTAENKNAIKQDIIEDSDDDGCTPGPGAYYDPKRSTFQSKPKAERIQFFGSTVQRFHESERSASTAPNVGPGFYDTDEKPSYKAKQEKQIGFNSNLFRWSKSVSLKDLDDNQNVTELPGPGAYQVQQSVVESLQRKTQGKNGVFGSTERRFVNIENMQTPGPGQYIHKIPFGHAPVGLPILKESLSQNKPKNQTKSAQDLLVKHIIQYDVETNTISGNLRQKIDAVNNPLLAHLTKQNENNSLRTFAPRWSNTNTNETDAFRGPGYYEIPKSQFDKVKKNKGIKSHQTLFSTAQRFELQKPKKVETPGPTEYNNIGHKVWFKKSYNMNFTEP